MDIAFHELYGIRELPPVLLLQSRDLVKIKTVNDFFHHELVVKKSLGENVIILQYNLYVDDGQVMCYFFFRRNLDQYGVPRHWQCACFSMTDNFEQILHLM